MLDVGDGHQIYMERVGRRDGIPAIYLHGGPGSGCQTAHRALFDPGIFSAVLFDQRGAGRSRPWLGLHANTTAHLVADIERIRMVAHRVKAEVERKIKADTTNVVANSEALRQISASLAHCLNARHAMNESCCGMICPIDYY